MRRLGSLRGCGPRTTIASLPIGISDPAGAIPDTYLQFPFVQALESGSIVTQELALDAGQSGIPVSLSNGVLAGFQAGGAGIHESAYLWTPLPSAVATGNFVFIGGSPVVQFK
jgi:hypothetical protein